MEFIDLGLSVKWAKYNLGSTHGSDPESWHGNYYAWGETSPKPAYGQLTYKWITNGSSYIKYNAKDKKSILEPDDDAVTAAYGENWRMPTKAELEELMTLPNEWVTDYNNITGLNGRIFKGNDNILFIPAAGSSYISALYEANYHCCLWSSSVKYDYLKCAWILNFYAQGIHIDYEYRYNRCFIRGVCE